jgi:hypothetical protein
MQRPARSRYSRCAAIQCRRRPAVATARDACATAAWREDLTRLCNANLVHKSILQNWVWKRGSGADTAGRSIHEPARLCAAIGTAQLWKLLNRRRAQPQARQSQGCQLRAYFGGATAHCLARARVVGSETIVILLILTMAQAFSVAGRPESWAAPKRVRSRIRRWIETRARPGQGPAMALNTGSSFAVTAGPKCPCGFDGCNRSIISQPWISTRA